MRILLASLLAVLLSLSAALAEEATTLSLDEAISLAMQNNHRVQSAEAQHEAAVALRNSAAARFGPSLSAEGRLLYWDDAHDIDVFDYIALNGTMRSAVDQLVGPIDPIEMRAETTKTLELTAVQPLTPLYSVYQGYKARSAGEQAMAGMTVRTRREVTFDTIEAYYRVLSVEKLRNVAAAAVETIQAHVTQAQDYYEAEFIDKTDLLTAQVALANAQEQLIRAENGLSLAKSALAQLIGLPQNDELVLIDQAAALPADLPLSANEAQLRADGRRLDLSALNHQVEAMEAVERLSWWQLTPQVAAIGRYQHNEGIILYEEDEMFVGLALEWNFWEWGRKYFEAQAAGAQTKQARIRRSEVSELIHLQIKQNFQELQSAKKRYETTAQAVARAEENLRIQQLQFEEGLTNSTDVLSAQTLLTQARGNKISAQYDVLTQYAALKLAMGEDPRDAVIPPLAAPAAETATPPAGDAQ